MKISHRISFPGSREFEQHECFFELESVELPEKTVATLNLLQVGQLLYSLAVINGLLYQRAEGYIDKDEYESRKTRVFSLLSAPLKEKLVEVLNVG